MPSQNLCRRRVAAKQSGRKRPSSAKAALAGRARSGALVDDTATANESLENALKVIDISRTALLQAKARLNVIQRDDLDDAERTEAAIELINVTRELGLLEARRRSLIDDIATLRPPSPAAIDEAQQRANQLARVLADNGKVAAIAGLASDIVQLTEKLVA